MTRHDVYTLTCKVYPSSLTTTNIQSAFKKYRRLPFNPAVISDPEVAPFTSFKREQTSPSLKPSVRSAKKVLQLRVAEILQNVETAKKQKNTLSKIV